MGIKLAIVASKDCQPCIELRDVLKDLTQDEVEFYEIDGDDEVQVNKAAEIVAQVGWSGMFPGVFLIREGKVITELAVNELKDSEIPFEPA